MKTELDFHPLSRERHVDAVAAFFERAADYVMFESGQLADASTAGAFFEDRAPGCDPGDSLKSACARADGGIIGIADMSFGYPEKPDAYIGLLLIDHGVRSQGVGRQFLECLVNEARLRKCKRMPVAVLDENARGRAFWEREGFVIEKSFEPRQIGSKVHVLHRLTRAL